MERNRGLLSKAVRVKAMLAGLVALAIFSFAAPVAQGAETEVRDEGTYGQTTFVIPTGGPLHASDCPTAQEEMHYTGKWRPCFFRLTVQAWSPKAQSLYLVFSDEGERREAEPEMPWSCRIDGRKLFWTVEMWTADVSWLKRETGSFDVFVPGCGVPAVIFRTVGITRTQARKAILEHLASFYVSRLSCDRSGKKFICKATFNNTFSECNATYRVGRTYNGSFTYTTVTALRKRCHPF